VSSILKSLDLGSGMAPRNPFGASEVFGVDLGQRVELPINVRHADLAIDPIPFDSDFFDCVTAFDFIEHIPRLVYCPHRRNSFVELMNEVYRVLKPSGYFLSSTPCYPHGSAFVDPTHVNFITEDTFSLYFCENASGNPWAVTYGFNGIFRILRQDLQGSHLVSLLQKIPT
jgi:SAM-dependent methyltransferase